MPGEVPQPQVPTHGHNLPVRDMIANRNLHVKITHLERQVEIMIRILETRITSQAKMSWDSGARLCAHGPNIPSSLNPAGDISQPTRHLTTVQRGDVTVSILDDPAFAHAPVPKRARPWPVRYNAPPAGPIHIRPAPLPPTLPKMRAELELPYQAKSDPSISQGIPSSLTTCSYQDTVARKGPGRLRPGTDFRPVLGYVGNSATTGPDKSATIHGSGNGPLHTRIRARSHRFRSNGAPSPGTGPVPGLHVASQNPDDSPRQPIPTPKTPTPGPITKSILPASWTTGDREDSALPHLEAALCSDTSAESTTALLPVVAVGASSTTEAPPKTSTGATRLKRTLSSAADGADQLAGSESQPQSRSGHTVTISRHHMMELQYILTAETH
ncbi:hypothetical protein B0T11DRAFT_273518 [Plectosphaerella cucumerina]|uniref:Uncharacterized protein n=1 Tax=Plectosphaerella cucumerina TaxID=40658 RepID=A0A8K0TRC7_9PEZI|nr:hypothetical protein B0T11DRAFT_273518 [Plectosphaerella cucumerina]